MKKQNELSSFVYPDKQEIKAAQLACCGRYCTSCESPAEYAWRKREVDMSLLLERAIHKELTETEKNAVMLHWYDGKSLTQISKEKGISAAAVKQTLDRANEKLEKVLSYAICYQQNIMTESIIPLAVGRARVIASARNSNEASAGERIARLIESQCLSRDALSCATGISVSRLLKIEKGAEIDASEIIALSDFFNVTTDYILKGEKNYGKENIA